MSKKLYEESNISAIADAIRSKSGSSDTFTTSEMAQAIEDIVAEPDLETLSVSQNGNYSPSVGKDGFSQVSVSVPTQAVLKTKTITQNGSYNALLDDDADGYSSVSVNVSGSTPAPDPSVPSEYQEIEYIDFVPHIGFLVDIPSTGIVEVCAKIRNASAANNDQTAFGYREYSNREYDFAFETVTGSFHTWMRSGNGYYGGSIKTVPNNDAIGNKVSIFGALCNLPRNSAFIGRYATYASAAYQGFDGQIYYIRITDFLSGALLAKFVPCYRKSDSSLGYYDVVNDIFYNTLSTTQGGGSISAGPDVN